MSITGPNSNHHIWICHYRKNHLLLKKGRWRKIRTKDKGTTETTVDHWIERIESKRNQGDLLGDMNKSLDQSITKTDILLAPLIK